MFSLTLALVLTARAEIVTGEKVVPGCYIVNLSKPVVKEFFDKRPELERYVKYRWTNGFTVQEFLDEKLFFQLVLNDRSTISVERCGIVRSYDVKDVSPASKRGVDRIDQRSPIPDGLLRRTAPGSGQNIYLVDSGLTPSQQLLGNVSSIYPLPPRSVHEDGAGHGSQMFEMIRNGGFGLAPGARVFSLKATSNVFLGGGGIDTVIDALRFLRDRSTAQGGTFEPGIVNLSLGQKVSPASTTSSSMELVLNDLRNDGFVIVAAAGNEGTSIVDQSTGFKVVPAAVAGTVTVAGLSVATPGVDTRWVENPCLGVDTCGSNFGPEVSLFAPATNQPTLEPNGNFTNLKGTSGSTAYVSAVLATIGDFRPNLGLGQRFAFLQSRWTASGVADARSANTGILMSDLGYVRKALGAAPLDRRPVFRGETGVGFGFATFEKWLPEGTFDQPTITEGAKVFLGTASSGLSVNAKPRIS